MKEGFGTVMLKEWMIDPQTGHQFIGVRGSLTVASDESIMGVKVRGPSENWGVKVYGAGRTVYLLGCQVRAIFEESPETEAVAPSILYLR